MPRRCWWEEPGYRPRRSLKGPHPTGRPNSISWLTVNRWRPDAGLGGIDDPHVLLEIGLAANHVHDIPADPHFFAFLAQIDAPGALERGALGCDIGRLGEPCPDEPLREAG